jgi:hypothetical protein
MEEQVYRDRLGLGCRVAMGRMDENAEHLFMNGQCHALAMEIARRQGWMVGMVCLYALDSDEMVGVPHIVACMPNGQLVDASGVHDEQDLLDMYGDDMEGGALEIVHPDDLMEQLGWLAESWAKPQTELAQSMVEPLLSQFGIEPVRPSLQGLDEAAALRADAGGLAMDGPAPELQL